MLKEFNIKQYKISHYYFNGISILCASLVPLLVFGPFFPDLIVSLLSIWFLYYSFKNKIYSIYQNVYFYIFIAFWLTCILSSLLSENIIVSLKSSLFYIRIGIFALMISFLISLDDWILCLKLFKDSRRSNSKTKVIIINKVLGAKFFKNY